MSLRTLCSDTDIYLIGSYSRKFNILLRRLTIGSGWWSVLPHVASTAKRKNYGLTIRQVYRTRHPDVIIGITSKDAYVEYVSTSFG